MPVHNRACIICGTDISSKRSHAKTCSASCRASLFRMNHGSACVIARITKCAYTNIALIAFKAGKSVQQVASDHLQAAFR